MAKPLTPAQRACLGDAERGPLTRTVAGWGLPGTRRWHAGQTIDALVGRGYLAVANRHSVRGGKGRATLTAAGEAAIGAARLTREQTAGPTPGVDRPRRMVDA